MTWLFILMTTIPLIFLPRKIFNGFSLPQTVALSTLSTVGLLLGMFQGLSFDSIPSKLLICLIIYLFISIIWSDPIHNAKKEIGLQLPLLILGLLSLSFIEIESFKWIALSITITIFLNTIYGFLQTKLIDPFFDNKIKKGGHKDKPIGTIGNANFFTAFLCGGIWLSIYTAINFNLIILLIPIFAIYLIFKSDIRAGQFAIIGSAIFLGLVISYFKYKLILDLSLSLMIILGLALILVIEHYWDILFYKQIDPKGPQVWYATFRYRICYWLAALELIKERPIFGWGLWGYRKNVYYAQAKLQDKNSKFLQPDRYITPQPREVHNEYLEHIVEYGLIGFLIFISFIGSIYYFGFNFLSDQVYLSDKFILMLFLLTNLTCLLLNGIWFFTFRIPSSGILFWLTCGSIISISNAANNIIEFPIWIILITAFILGSIIWYCLIKRLLASYYFMEYQINAQNEQGSNYLNKAIQCVPNDNMLRTHATIMAMDYDPAISNLHAMKLVEHYDGMVPQHIAFFNIALARVRTQNIFDEAIVFLKTSHWLYPFFKPVINMLNGRDSISSRSRYRGGRAEMRKLDEGPLWKVRAFMTEKNNIGLKIENLTEQINHLQTQIKLADQNIQTFLIAEKKRLNIPDSWTFNVEAGEFRDPNVSQ